MIARISVLAGVLSPAAQETPGDPGEVVHVRKNTLHGEEIETERQQRPWLWPQHKRQEIKTASKSVPSQPATPQHRGCSAEHGFAPYPPPTSLPHSLPNERLRKKW